MGGMAEKPLTPRQKRFVDEYLIDLNSTAAYRRAGYEPKTDNAAAASASALLRKPKIVAALREAQLARSKRTGITQDYVLTRLRDNVERAMRAEPVLDREGKPTGEYVYEGAVANRALELLGRHLGMFADKVEHRLRGSGPGGEVEHSVKVQPEGVLSARIARYESCFKQLAPGAAPGTTFPQVGQRQRIRGSHASSRAARRRPAGTLGTVTVGPQAVTPVAGPPAGARGERPPRRWRCRAA
jgi:phage terminase small subunit